MFLRYNELLKPILEQYKSIVGKRTQTTIPLELDQFFSWLHENKRADKPLKNLIETYKKHIQESELKDELYKWKFIEDFNGKPDLDAENFQEEIKSIKWGNLVYAMSGGGTQSFSKRNT